MEILIRRRDILMSGRLVCASSPIQRRAETERAAGWAAFVQFVAGKACDRLTASSLLRFALTGAGHAVRTR